MMSELRFPLKKIRREKIIHIDMDAFLLQLKNEIIQS